VSLGGQELLVIIGVLVVLVLVLRIVRGRSGHPQD
jgi:hypothetical protein